MNLLSPFFHTFIEYGQELWLILAIGFFLSGIFYEFIPEGIVEKYLGKKGFKPIFIASVIGTILPVCCIGSLPIALTLKRKGASLGSVLAFLVATPATSISALVVCWKLLGGIFTFSIFIAVLIMGLIMGFVANGIQIHSKENEFEEEKKSCCQSSKNTDSRQNAFLNKMKNAFQYAFMTLPKEMGKEILLGIAVASFITVYEPIHYFIQEYLTGVLGYFCVLVVGLLTYVCSTASVPMADAFLQSGMSQGQALCYLLAGPVTSYGTILVIKKDFGGHVLVLYLSIICIFALFSGMVFDLFIFQ